jgi:signal peptidase II
MSQFLKISLPLFILDQLTKVLIIKNFNLGDEKAIIPNFFNLVRVHNTGIAFGKFNDTTYSNIIFSIIATIALVTIIILWKKNKFPGTINNYAIILLMPGILGNLIDRIWHGYVVDFLDFYIKNYHWPSFNIADSCICISAGLLFISAFKSEDK